MWRGLRFFRSSVGLWRYGILERVNARIQYRGLISPETDGMKFVHIANSIELKRQSRIVRAHLRGDCYPRERVGRVCLAGQRQECAVTLQNHVVLTRRKNFAVTFKAEGHIDRSLVDREGRRCAKDGRKNEHPSNRAHITVSSCRKNTCDHAKFPKPGSAILKYPSLGLVHLMARSTCTNNFFATHGHHEASVSWISRHLIS
jgi:hypothetical protein